jgi:hypothetical protein
MTTQDLKERGLCKQGMSEVAQRREMESRLRLEDEKKQMNVLTRDRRFEGRGGKVSDDIGRVLIDTLHAPTRMNEKVLHVLCSVAHNNKTKKQAAGVFGKMKAKLRSMGALGEWRGVQFEDKNCDKLSSFALPHDQSKRMFNKAPMPGLHEVIDIARGPKKIDALDVRAFMLQHARPSPTVCASASLPSLPNANTNAPTLSSPVGTSRCSNFYRLRGNARRGSWTCWLSETTLASSWWWK